MKQNFVCKDFKPASFTVALNTTNYDVATNTGLWAGTANPVWFKMKISQPVTIKINSTTAQDIPVTTSENEFEFYISNIANVYITTTAASNITFTLIWL